MKRDTKNILLGVVLGVLLFTVVSELSAYSARSSAISDLNKVWSSLKNSSDKIAAIIKADTIIANNQSAFSFLNSSADKGADEFAFYDGGDVWGWMDRVDGPQPQVETVKPLLDEEELCPNSHQRGNPEHLLAEDPLPATVL